MWLCGLSGSTRSSWPEHTLEHTDVLSLPSNFKTNLYILNLSCQESWVTALRELVLKPNATYEGGSRSKAFINFARQRGGCRRLGCVLCSRVSLKAQHFAFKLFHILAKTYLVVDVWVGSAKDRLSSSPSNKFQLLRIHSLILVLFSALERANAERPFELSKYTSYWCSFIISLLSWRDKRAACKSLLLLRTSFGNFPKKPLVNQK